MRYKYETHMHTSKVSRCARSTAVEQVRAYKNRGYAGVIITDHFINGNCNCPRELPWKQKMDFFASGYEEALAEGKKCGLDVFYGWEYCIRGTEFLTYGLDQAFLLANPGFDKLTAAAYSALVRKSGGYLAQAHPFRDDSYIDYKLPVAPYLLDGVEIYNASMPASTNAKAAAFAKQHGVCAQAGSDSHHKDFPAPSGIALDKRAESIFDIIAAIRENRAELLINTL